MPSLVFDPNVFLILLGILFGWGEGVGLVDVIFNAAAK